MRKIKSTSMSVRTQYNALDEKLEIVNSNGTLTQWYNVSSSPQYKPDRSVNNLLLSVSLVVTDPDSKRQYTPTISNVTWYYITYSNNAEVENACAQNTDDYTVSGRNLYVKKNVSPTSGGLTILAMVTYADPRSNEPVTIKKRVVLLSMQDSTQSYNVFINAPKVVRFDPVSDYDIADPTSSRLSISARATFGEQNADASKITFEWYGFDSSVSEDSLIDAVDSTASDSTHIPVNIFPCYVSGQGTSTLILDRMYCNGLKLTCRLRLKATGELLPCTDSVTIAWQVLPITPVVYTREGTAINDKSSDKTFRVALNVKGGSTLTDAQAKEHFAFRWARRKGVMTNTGTQAYTDLGWGHEMKVKVADLKNTYNTADGTVYDSTVVKADIYLKEENCIVVLGDQVVVLGDAVVVDRKLY